MSATALVDEIKDTLVMLHSEPEMDARDRHSIFIISDMLANLSFCRERQSAALAELIGNCTDHNLPTAADVRGIMAADSTKDRPNE